MRVEWRTRLRVRRGRLESGGGGGQAVHAAAYPRKRLLILDSSLRRNPRERNRILLHELFHFVWARLGNGERRGWEQVLAAEMECGAAGELGWSAEWRKAALHAEDWRERTRRWREYACESFCDTAAWRWSGTDRHGEYTLERAARAARRRWMDAFRRHHPAGWRI